MEGTGGFTSENVQSSALDVDIFSEALLSLLYFYLGLNQPFFMAGLDPNKNVIVGNNLGGGIPTELLFIPRVSPRSFCGAAPS